MSNEEQTAQTQITPDLAELGELCGCTDKQIKFAEGMLQGMSQTEAAFHAGYSGARDSVQLRSAGSSAARSKPVQALLALAESRGLGIPNAPGDMDELRRILWSHARSKDKAHSIKAAAELQRIEREERTSKDQPADLAKALNDLAALCPEAAAHLAGSEGITLDILSDNYRQEVARIQEQTAKNWIKEHAHEAKTVAEYFQRPRLVIDNLGEAK